MPRERLSYILKVMSDPATDPLTDPATEPATKPVDEQFMRAAIAEAERAGLNGEVPVGAVVVADGEIIGRGGNQSIRFHDPTGHAEIVALRRAARNVGNYRLTGCTLYVTVEPCAMCAGAAVWARIERLVYGCDDPKAGVIGTLFRLTEDPRLNHRIETASGVLSADCADILQEFFKMKRSAEKKRD